MIRSSRIRSSARGESCTLQVAGVCNGNSETVIYAHFRWLGGCGVGIKPTDLGQGAYACSACHDWLDGRMPHGESYLSDRNFYAMRGMVRTLERLVDKGIIQIAGAE